MLLLGAGLEPATYGPTLYAIANCATATHIPPAGDPTASGRGSSTDPRAGGDSAGPRPLPPRPPVQARRRRRDAFDDDEGAAGGGRATAELGASVVTGWLGAEDIGDH